MATLVIQPQNPYKIHWKHPFWWFTVATILDFFLTAWAAIHYKDFHELNPGALKTFETGQFWFPLIVKILSILGVYAVLVIIRQANMERHFRKIIVTFAIIFTIIDLLSTAQIILG